MAEDIKPPTGEPEPSATTAEVTSIATRKPLSRFKPGQSGNPAGRPVGPNKATIEAKAAANEIIDNPEYRRLLAERVMKGTAPHMEPLLWAYGKGKPVDRVEQGGPGAFAALDDDELRRRLAEVVLRLA